MSLPEPYYQDTLATLYLGDVREVLAQLPEESVHCCVTSPPYWGLRDYGIESVVWGGSAECRHEWGPELIVSDSHSDLGTSTLRGSNRNQMAASTFESKSAFCSRCGAWRGSLGLEPTPDLYVEHLVEVFRAVRRVLRKDGTVWLNMGDSYWGGKGQNASSKARRTAEERGYQQSVGTMLMDTRPSDGKHAILKPKDLCGMPWRVAFALQADGWWLRMDIIWKKDNPMPESVDGWRWERHRIKVGNKGRTQARIPGHFQNHSGNTVQSDAEWVDCPGCPKCEPNDGLILRKGAGRPTRAHEYVFLLSKSAKYFWDREAVKMPVAESTIGRGPVDFGGKKGREYNPEPGDPNYRAGSEQWGRTFNYEESCANGRNMRSVWTIPTAPFSGWTQTSRRVDVALGDVSDDTMRTPSPGCPIHDSLDRQCGGHAGVGLIRKERICLDRAESSDAEPPGDSNSNVSQHPGCSLGSQGQLCAASAIDHSTESRRTDLDPVTSQPCNVSAQTPCHTDGMSELPGSGEHTSHTGESNTSAGCASDGMGSVPSVQTPCHSADTSWWIPPECTCSFYHEVTEKSSHFATFPPALVDPCIKAGSSEYGCCPKCGAPWVRVVEASYKKNRPSAGEDPRSRHEDKFSVANETSGFRGNNLLRQTETIGFDPSCNCWKSIVGDHEDTRFPRFSRGWLGENRHPDLFPVPCTVLSIPSLGAARRLSGRRRWAGAGSGLTARRSI